MANVTAFLRSVLTPLAVSIVLAALPSAVHAASCGNGAGGFGSWLAAFRQRAAAEGISQGTIESALGGVSYDPRVIRLRAALSTMA